MWGRCAFILLTLLKSCSPLDDGQYSTLSTDTFVLPDEVEPKILEVKPMLVQPPLHTGFPARDQDDSLIINRSLSEEIRLKLKLEPEAKIIRAAVLMDPPFVASLNLSDEFHNGRWYSPGLIIQIMIAMQKLHNFQYEFIAPKDGVWGEADEEGNWSGMFGMLQRGEVDMVAAASIVRYDRREVAEYTYPFYSSEMGMLIRSPERYIDNRFLIVTAPFHKYVWALVALAIVVSGGMMKALSTALRSASEVQYTLLQATWVFFSVFVQQGLPLQPKSWSCRTLLAFWWLAALTLMATFTGNMVALFAVNRSYLPFNSREEMVHKVRYDGYTVVTTNASITRLKFLQNSQLPIFRTLWYEMTVNGKWINASTYEEGIEIVKRTPNMVLLGSREALQVYTARDCSVTTTNGGLLPVMYAMAFKKSSYLTDLWSEEVRELIELGFITKWLKDYMHAVATERGRRCFTGEGLTNAGDAIDVVRAQGAFWILLAGAAVASIGLIAEHIVRLAINTLQSIDNERKAAHLQTSFSSRCRLEDDASYQHNSTIGHASDYECARSYQPNHANGLKFDLKLRRGVRHIEIARF